MATYSSIDFNVHKSFHNICTVPQYHLLIQVVCFCERVQHEDTTFFIVAGTKEIQREKAFYTRLSSLKRNKTLEKPINDQDLTLP